MLIYLHPQNHPLLSHEDAFSLFVGRGLGAEDDLRLAQEENNMEPMWMLGRCFSLLTAGVLGRFDALWL